MKRNERREGWVGIKRSGKWEEGVGSGRGWEGSGELIRYWAAGERITATYLSSPIQLILLLNFFLAPRHRLSGSNQMAAQRKPKDSGGCLYNCSEVTLDPEGWDISSLQSPPIVFLIAIWKMSYLCICAPRERKRKKRRMGGWAIVSPNSSNCPSRDNADTTSPRAASQSIALKILYRHYENITNITRYFTEAIQRHYKNITKWLQRQYSYT